LKSYMWTKCLTINIDFSTTTFAYIYRWCVRVGHQTHF